MFDARHSLWSIIDYFKTSGSMSFVANQRTLIILKRAHHDI